MKIEPFHKGPASPRVLPLQTILKRIAELAEFALMTKVGGEETRREREREKMTISQKKGGDLHGTSRMNFV